MGQPDFMAGADLGRHGCKFHRQLLDQGLADRCLEMSSQLVAANQARAVEADIEIAEDISRLQAARPLFERIQMPRGIGAADYIGDDAVRDQRPDNADMGKSTGSAATQGEPDHRPPDAAETYLVTAIRAVLAAPDQNIQHRRSPESTRLCTKAWSRQNVPQAWFMPRCERPNQGL